MEMRRRKDVCILAEGLDIPKAFFVNTFLPTGTVVTASLQFLLYTIPLFLSKGCTTPPCLGLLG